MTCPEVHGKLAQTPRWVHHGHPRALRCSCSEVSLTAPWLRPLVPCFSKVGGVSFSTIISTVTPHYSQIPYLQICLLTNIYCNPQINAPCTVATHGRAQAGKSLSLPSTHSQLRSNMFLVFLSAGNKCLFNGLLSAISLAFVCVCW